MSGPTPAGASAAAFASAHAPRGAQPGGTPAAPIDGRSFAAAQAFILETKTFWTTRLYPALRDEYQRRASLQSPPPQTAEDVARVLTPSTLYHYYAWFERHLQRFKYAGRYGLQPWHAQARERLMSELKEGEAVKDLLELNPDLELPRYYTAVDIHQHPGGVWSDPVAGAVYERGARSTTPLAKKHFDLHGRLTREALARCPEPARVLDMACGFGKSTRPFAEALPKSEIHAVDLAEPCLRLAARTAAEQGTANVRYRQMDATETDYPDQSFDLVTSTMFLHEMPPAQIEKSLRECHRLLRPGGKMVHLDFIPKDDPFHHFIHYGHGRRNNEPFMEPMVKMGLAERLAQLGFRNIEIRPFEEADGTLAPDYPNWRFPWTLIVAER